MGPKRYMQAKGPKPRPVKRYKPTLTFGPCPKCKQERTSVHRCPLNDEIRTLVHRELYQLTVTEGKSGRRRLDLSTFPA